MSSPTDDPRKLLYAAARWMTAVGWAYVSFGLLFVFLGFRARPIALTGACLLASGGLFLIAGPFARRHRGWAVWLGIATALLAGAALALLLMLLVMRVGWRDLVQIRSIVSAAAALLLLVLMFVHLMIVWNLSNCFEAVDAPQVAAARLGFEPVVLAAPRPVLKMESIAAPPATGEHERGRNPQA